MPAFTRKPFRRSRAARAYAPRHGRHADGASCWAALRISLSATFVTSQSLIFLPSPRMKPNDFDRRMLVSGQAPQNESEQERVNTVDRPEVSFAAHAVLLVVMASAQAEAKNIV